MIITFERQIEQHSLEAKRYMWLWVLVHLQRAWLYKALAHCHRNRFDKTKRLFGCRSQGVYAVHP